MFFNPFIQALVKYKKHINDFFVQAIILIIVYLADTFAVSTYNYNNLIVSFLGFIICYVLARIIIRSMGEKENFGSFVNESIHYCVLLSLFAWFFYVILVHIRKFH